MNGRRAYRLASVGITVCAGIACVFCEANILAILMALCAALLGVSRFGAATGAEVLRALDDELLACRKTGEALSPLSGFVGARVVAVDCASGQSRLRQTVWKSDVEFGLWRSVRTSLRHQRIPQATTINRTDRLAKTTDL